MSPHRLLANLEKFKAITATPGDGVTRFSWTEEDRAAKRLLADLCRGAGLEVAFDGAGNLRAQSKRGGDGPAVALGSHLDSVRNGGSLDGVYGVAAALEAIQSILESGASLARPLRLMAFAEEEGSNFGCTCLGSKLVCGQADANFLAGLSADGESAWDRLIRHGLDPAGLPGQQISPANTLCFLEAHIEQNDRLESEGAAVGVVSRIHGMRLCETVFRGVSDHAATPMAHRRDPMLAFAEHACALGSLCDEYGGELAATVGKIQCRPNSPIVSAQSVLFTTDLRHPDKATLAGAMAEANRLADAAASRHGVAASHRLLSASGGVSLDPRLRSLLGRLADEEGARWLELPSWPAHDAAAMACVVPSAMIFVPSVRGLSHCKEEFTRPEDLCLGARILEKAALALASEADPLAEY